MYNMFLDMQYILKKINLKLPVFLLRFSEECPRDDAAGFLPLRHVDCPDFSGIDFTQCFVYRRKIVFFGN